MRTEQAAVTAFTIFEAKALDPITVFIQNYAPGVGRIVIECYGSAWSTYWGAMGEQNVQQFVAICGSDYIANRLWPERQRRIKADYAYLVRIVEAVQAALRTTLETRCDRGEHDRGAADLCTRCGTMLMPTLETNVGAKT